MLIGWAAVTGSLDWPAVVVFGVVFCWQMPHFWALALRFKDDYARADVPMLPVVTTAVSVGRQSVAWAYATVAVSLSLWPIAADYGIGLGYTIAAALLGAGSSSRRTACCAGSCAAATSSPCSCSTSRSRTWRC
ncbi:UbiA family prenyltransferase [Blastococcus brunescens]|uniref:heme o synthase n=1 Tax=Blastococcus brunescens TaxID=1564165 RepID=A0ABZ1ATK5_9ACTN|nr:UbiA family prenyltransferase [Blastococcus sp. BMG 8361]WRL61897.1 UbiA family prenyltransferase [Blastococcus sp. BMG 8361]